MTIYRGTYYELPFQLLQRADGVPLNISTWKFRTEIRQNPADAAVLITATTDDGQWVTSDGENGKFKLVLTPEQTAVLPLGYIYGDLIRTDSPNGRILLIASIREFVADPITRT